MLEEGSRRPDARVPPGRIVKTEWRSPSYVSSCSQSAHLSAVACELLQPMSSSLLDRKLAPPPSAGAREGSSGATRISATSRLSLAPSAEA